MRFKSALRVFALVVGLWVGWQAAEARADECGGAIAPPVISVRTQVKPPTQDLRRSISELSSDTRIAVPRGLQDFKYAVGATAAEPEDHTKWGMRGVPMRDGRKCWSVTNVNVVIAVSTKVYIAKEVPRGSCLWNEVVKHESKHVRLDQKLFPQIAGLIRPKVLRAVSRSVAARTDGEARTALGSRISQAILVAATAFLEMRNTEQLKIDTRTEYSRANRVCGEAEVAAAIKRAGLR